MSTHQRKGTVLFLHGWAQNAYVMRSRTSKLEKRLNQAGYKCVYLEASHLLPMTSNVEVDGEVVQVTNGGRENAKAWFTYSKLDSADATTALGELPMEYIGLNDSIDIVRKCLSKCDDGFCVLGFSQGATFGHILSQLACSAKQRKDETNPFCKIHSAVLLSGFASMHNLPLPNQPPSEQAASDTAAASDGEEANNKLNMKSLHIYGERDTSVPKAYSEKLANCFQDPELYVHDKSHFIPHNRALIDRVIGFLDACYSCEGS